MVAAAVLSAVSLGVATAVNYQNRGVRNVAQSLEFHGLSQHITLLISNDRLCRNSPFRAGNAPAAWANRAQPLDLSEIRVVGDDGSANVIANLQPRLDGIRVSQMRFRTVGNPSVYDLGVMTLPSGDVRRAINADLVVTAQKVATAGIAVQGNRELSRTFPVVVLINEANNQITNCYTGGASGTSLTEADVCAVMGGVYNLSRTPRCTMTGVAVAQDASDAHWQGPPANGIYSEGGITTRGQLRSANVDSQWVVASQGLQARDGRFPANYVTLSSYANEMYWQFTEGTQSARQLLRITTGRMGNGQDANIYLSSASGSGGSANVMEVGAYNSSTDTLSAWNRGGARYLNFEAGRVTAAGGLRVPANAPAAGTGPRLMATADAAGNGGWMKPVMVVWRTNPTYRFSLSYRAPSTPDPYAGGPTNPQNYAEAMSQLNYPGLIDGSNYCTLNSGDPNRAPTYCQTKVQLNGTNMFLPKPVVGAAAPPAFTEPDECHVAYIEQAVDEQIRDCATGPIPNAQFGCNAMSTGQAASACNVAYDPGQGWHVHVYRQRYGSIRCDVQCTKMMMMDAAGNLH